MSDIPLYIKRSWHPPLLGALPPDFLRLGGSSPRHGHAYTHPSSRPPATLSHEAIRERMTENTKKLGELSCQEGGAEANQMLEDERFALMLQNEEFMTELRGNHEFLSTLEQDHRVYILQ